jgi:rhodanese-related sulfurtransferase
MNEILPADLQSRIRSGEKFILIDVREPHEHDEYDIGGLNIPITELPFRIDEIKAAEEGEPLVLYCQSGNRSILAQKLLSLQFGIDNTYNLQGGINAWKAETGE